MQLSLSMTSPNSQQLLVDVPNATLEECVDGLRASFVDGVVMIERTFGATKRSTRRRPVSPSSGR